MTFEEWLVELDRNRNGVQIPYMKRLLEMTWRAAFGAAAEMCAAICDERAESYRTESLNVESGTWLIHQLADRAWEARGCAKAIREEK